MPLRVATNHEVLIKTAENLAKKLFLCSNSESYSYFETIIYSPKYQIVLWYDEPPNTLMCPDANIEYVFYKHSGVVHCYMFLWYDYLVN